VAEHSAAQPSLELEYTTKGCPVNSSFRATDIDSTQAVPLASANSGQPKTNTAPSVDPIPQHLGIFDPKVLDDAYYIAVLWNYLLPDRSDIVRMHGAPGRENIECISFSAGSYEWNTDWQSPGSGAARLCMSNGHISPKHLRELTSTFRLSPAFLVGHLGSALENPPTWPICPPLPSQRNNMGHVRFLTLAQLGPASTDRSDFSSMPTRRDQCRDATALLVYKPNVRFGETRVRDVHMHNPRYFSVEQVVSFSFVREVRKTTGLVSVSQKRFASIG
jgi:hypothetical protein